MSGHVTYRAGAIRYQVTDVERAVAFYSGHLGFDVALRGGPAFASVVNGNLTVFLSGPDSSGVVCFQNAGGGRTEVTLKMRYDPSTGWEDREQIESRLQRNLRRFKDLVEKPLEG